MSNVTETFWNDYLETIPEKNRPDHPHVEISIAGSLEIADQLLELYLSGKKFAGSSLVKDYVLAEDELPSVGNYWMVLDSKESPKCILKTTRVEKNLFKNITSEIAKAEGEGDLSVDFWKRTHREFFEPFLEGWEITNLDEEEVITEFYELVYKV